MSSVAGRTHGDADSGMKETVEKGAGA